MIRLLGRQGKCWYDVPMPGGYSTRLGWAPEQYDQQQLMMGLQVELEHTPSAGMSLDEARPEDIVAAGETTMDHLAEQVLAGHVQDYYTRLLTCVEGDLRSNVGRPRRRGKAWYLRHGLTPPDPPPTREERRQDARGAWQHAKETSDKAVRILGEVKFGRADKPEMESLRDAMRYAQATGNPRDPELVDGIARAVGETVVWWHGKTLQQQHDRLRDLYEHSKTLMQEATPVTGRPGTPSDEMQGIVEWCMKRVDAMRYQLASGLYQKKWL